MKIVLVTPLLDHGGGQRFITELANYWAKLNYDEQLYYFVLVSLFIRFQIKFKFMNLDIYTMKDRVS